MPCRWLSPDQPQFTSLIDEVTQETLLRVLDQLDTFEGRSQFTTRVHKIAVRIALTELRRKRWRDSSLDELTENEDVPPPQGLLNDGNSGREIFLQFVRRPGIPLVVIGLLMLLQALVMFLGYREINEGPGWMVKISLLFSRMMPGVILFVLGLGALGLRLLEIVAPVVFDAMGGGFLETLYGI